MKSTLKLNFILNIGLFLCDSSFYNFDKVDQEQKAIIAIGFMVAGVGFVFFCNSEIVKRPYLIQPYYLFYHHANGQAGVL